MCAVGLRFSQAEDHDVHARVWCRPRNLDTQPPIRVMRHLKQAATLSASMAVLLACGGDDSAASQTPVFQDGAVAGDVSGDAPEQVPGPAPTCEELPSDFATCGSGRLPGTWRMVTYCPAGDLYDPLDGTCPDIVGSGEGSGDSFLRLEGQGTFAWNFENVTNSLAFSFALACYGGSTRSCDGRNFDGTCTLEEQATRCRCSVSQLIASFVQTGQWSTSLSTISFESGLTQFAGTWCINSESGDLELFREQIDGFVPARMVFRRVN